MGWVIFILFWIVIVTVLQFKNKTGKIYGSATGQRICVYCHKKMKYSGVLGVGSYGSVCPRCGRTQPNRETP
jgi:hypothetical protein